MTQEAGESGPGDKCSTCGGEGWVTESEHGCDGTEAVCLTTCPIPVQAPRPACSAPPAVSPPTSDDEEPF